MHVCAAKTLGGPGTIGQSQRRLLYMDVDADTDAAGSGELSVYALEGCGRHYQRRAVYRVHGCLPSAFYRALSK
jgi:hypothetical protein